MEAIKVRGFFYRLGNTIRKFMYGRYGIDRLHNALLIAYLVLFVLNLFVRIPLFSLLSFACLIWAFFRVFSRNHAARRRENEVYLKLLGQVKAFFKLSWDRIRECRTHIYHKCPHCHATLRLPRRRGKHTVRCPRCGEYFDMNVILGRKS